MNYILGKGSVIEEQTVAAKPLLVAMFGLRSIVLRWVRTADGYVVPIS